MIELFLMNSYLADYEKQHPTHSDRVYCNNYALNAILSFYADKAESAGIQFDIHIQSVRIPSHPGDETVRASRKSAGKCPGRLSDLVFRL